MSQSGMRSYKGDALAVANKRARRQLLQLQERVFQNTRQVEKFGGTYKPIGRTKATAAGTFRCRLKGYAPGLFSFIGDVLDNDGSVLEADIEIKATRLHNDTLNLMVPRILPGTEVEVRRREPSGEYWVTFPFFGLC